MTEATGSERLRRILVALDASEDSQRALEATARLAADLDAELVGLFVEEAELMQAAALPATRLIPSQGQGQATLDTALMRRALNITSSRARSALEATAARWRVRWSFQVVHGALGEEVLSQSRTDDLLALGRSRRIRREARPEQTPHRVASEATCSVLLLQRGETRPRPVVVLYEESERALMVALALARAESRALRIVALGDDEAAASARVTAATDWLARSGRRGAVQGLVGDAPAETRAVLRGLSPGVVVMDCRGRLASSLELEALAEELSCSVLALRA